MTLCIAWRDDGDVVHFAGDSRLKMEESCKDIATKVSAISCKIHSAIPVGETQPPVVYEFDLALAFAGSHLSSYSIKECITVALQSLQFAATYCDPSMDQVAELFRRAFETVSRDVNDVWGKKGFAQIFMAGFCPKEKRVRVFKYNPISEADHVDYDCVEIIKEPMQLSMIGEKDGRIAAEQLLAQGVLPEFALAVVIDNEEIKSVGGPVQYGYFSGGKFIICAEIIYELDPPKIKYMRGPFDSNGINVVPQKYDDLHISSPMRQYRNYPPAQKRTLPELQGGDPKHYKVQ